MESKGAFFLFSCIFILLLAGCVDPYEPPAIQANNYFLVVEGFINTGEGPTEFTLSRTARLADTARIKAERGAEVSVEGKDSDKRFRLQEKESGVYTMDPYNFSKEEEYRLRIKTAGGREYLSEFVPIKESPAIDSISWRRIGDDVQIYVNTHDPDEETRYYRWDFLETWEIHSAFYSKLKYENGELKDRHPDSLIYYCWQSDNSDRIQIGSSAKLAEDIIYRQPVTKVSLKSWKLVEKYSINVKQYALTEGAYLYFEQMKKNSEQLGSFFDPQPSEISGNIKCINDPDEPVIGFVYASSTEEKRIFIESKEIPDWQFHSYIFECNQMLVNVTSDSMEYYFDYMFYVPIEYDILTDTHLASTKYCTDCRERGTTTKPDFWE